MNILKKALADIGHAVTPGPLLLPADIQELESRAYFKGIAQHEFHHLMHADVEGLVGRIFGKVVAPAADDAEAARAAEEKRLADEAEAQRLADIEAARVAEEKRLADEAEAQRLAAEEAENARKAAEAEEQRLAAEAEAQAAAANAVPPAGADQEQGAAADKE